MTKYYINWLVALLQKCLTLLNIVLSQHEKTIDYVSLPNEENLLAEGLFAFIIIIIIIIAALAGWSVPLVGPCVK